MTMTKQNSGKYLSKEFERTLAKGVKDRDDLTAAEIAWVELADNEGLGRDDPDTFKQDMYPMDSGKPGSGNPVKRKKLDIRSGMTQDGDA